MTMSLTTSDLQEIRTIVEQAMRPLRSEVHALRNDIKEIYDTVADLEKAVLGKEFDKLDLEEKILTLHSKLVHAAKQAGITLPR
jgi:hypothetical protein